MYIRTEDGIYELVDELYFYHNGIEKFWYAKEENGTTLAIEITADKILNKSENPYELCDAFVLIEKNAKPIIFKTLRGAINNKIYDDETIYGAIWTDKGLIYVAKVDNGRGF